MRRYQPVTSLSPAVIAAVLCAGGCLLDDDSLDSATSSAPDGSGGDEPTTPTITGAEPTTGVTPTTDGPPPPDDSSGAIDPPDDTTSTGGSTGSAVTTDGVDATSTGAPDDTTGAASTTGTTGVNDTTGVSDTTGVNDTTGTSTSTGEPVESDTAEPPPPEYAIAVKVVGLVGDEAVFTLNDGEQLPVAAPGEFAFTTTLAAGLAYDVALTGVPPHYECALEDAAGVMPAGDVVVTSVCAPRPSATLVIAEVGHGYYTNDSYWLEISNISQQSQSLAGVTVRAPAYALDAENKYVADKGMQEFALPAQSLPAGGRLLVRGAIAGETAAGPGMALISTPGDVVPHWRFEYGAIELRKAGESIDYVAWGAIPNSKVGEYGPAHPSAWPGYPAGLAPAPMKAVESRGRSLARALALADSNAAVDLATLEFSTPAGPNDTHGCVADGDKDGLPDCAEAPGKTYAGVDLYAYGARPDKRDIFVEIDMMDPKGADGVTLDPGMVPQRTALDRIVGVFAQNGIALHFDVGDLFDQSAGIDPKDHDLGGGAQIPFAARTCMDSEPDCAWIVDLKAKHFTLPRLKSFHHALFVNKGAKDNYGGQGERPGNDLYVSLGAKNYKTTTTTDKNVLINAQAQTLMHELGHNLGLSHGGYSEYNGDAVEDEANWKPNYVSIMNYLYGAGLPTIGTKEGDRYYYHHEDENPACAAKGVDFCTMQNPMCGDPALFRLDYSHGLGGAIDTAAVVETKGLMQPGSGGVDFDCDGVLEAQSYASSLYAAVDGKDVAVTTLKDHDDWASLDLFFVTRYSGFNNGAIHGPAERDIQPRAPADPLPPALLAWLRARP